MAEEIVEIRGGQILEGEINLSGAKNAALPLIVAACLGEAPTVLENVPIQLNDVRLQIELMRLMGAAIVEEGGDVLRCSRGALGENTVPGEIASKIRTSLLLLGVYAGLGGRVFIPQPGGCQIGDRKYDLHLMGLQKLGARVEDREDGILLEASRLKGNYIDFYLPTTTGTENVMIAAALAEGETRIRNANTRPEIHQLGQLLAAMGAKVKVQNRIIDIEGTDELRGGIRFKVMPGWDEAVTYIIAAGITRGEIGIRNIDLSLFKEETRYLRESGIELFEWRGNLYVSGKSTNNPFELFTAPYPGVNSDMQPLFAALALSIDGVSTITDLRFTDRFQYVEELKRFGADIDTFGNTAIIRGGGKLSAADIEAPDLRGGMACVLCGLAAEGTTRIHNIYQIERGYEHFVEKLQRIGADVRKIAA